MKVTSIKTHKITSKDTDLLSVLDQYVPAMAEGSILAIASKIVAFCEGRIVKVGKRPKHELVREEAQYYIDTPNTYNITLAIKDNILIASSGIDESNADDHYILWPKNSQDTANKVRESLRQKFDLKKVGVIIVDSRTTVLRWGTTGVALAISGFKPLKDYIGQNDIFGRPLQYTKASIMDGLAAAAVMVMGEGDEQTPLAMIDDLTGVVEFVNHNPTPEELKEIYIDIDTDIYAPLLKSVAWKKGKNRG